jgi:hypothetical protein
MGDAMVALYVGLERVKFVAHKALLCEKSPYFEKMFKGDFKEAITESAEFPETDVVSFDVLLNWMYHGTLRDYHDLPVEGKKPCSNWGFSIFYKLSEMLQIPYLMDQIVDRYLKDSLKCNTLPWPAQVSAGYMRTAPNSPVRRILSYCTAHAVMGNVPF